MTDIVDRLRAVDHMSVEDCFLQSPLFSHAADEIERLRAALREYVCHCPKGFCCNLPCGEFARAALEEKG